MVPRETLLSLACKKDGKTLTDFVKTLQAEGSSQLKDILGSCSRQQLEALWENLQQTCTVTLGVESQDEADPDLQEMQGMHSTLHALAALANASLAALDRQKDFPPALLQTAIILHGVLNSLPMEEEGLRNALSLVFETWWTQGLEGREELGLNTITYLLQRSLAPKSTGADVRRVWALHDFLTAVNLDSPLSESLRQLLQRCLLHPSFLRLDEGRKFLAFLFTLNENFIKSLHATVKAQLPAVTSVWLEKYGDIYCRAWQRATGSLLKKLEKDCIQDLMCAAVHAQRTGPKPLASTLRKVLKVFHSQKKLKGVDEMLYRLYEPILWRALMMPNPTVRANATNIFFDAFPLQNPTANVGETDILLQKQFDLITTLLGDPCAIVRALATQGACRVMSVYWELIPAPILRSFFVRLVQELAWDAASAEVREATLRGLHLLLDNHHSHLVLKPILPQLSRMIHDVSEKVRIAMLDLLLKVKGIRAIKWWMIVPVEHLLKRLEVDGAPIVRRLMRLLFNSFVPLEAGDEALVDRCLVMIESNVAAARVFFQNIHKHITITDMVAYMTLLCRWALVWAKKAQQRDQSLEGQDASAQSPRSTLQDGGRESNVEEEGEAGGEMESVELLVGVLEVLVILWTTVIPKLNEPGMLEQKQGLQKKLSIMIPEVLKAADEPRAWHASVLLASRLPPAAIPTLSRSLQSRLRRLEAGSLGEDYGTMLEAMCKWRKADDVLELINDWLTSALSPSPTPKPASSKGKQEKRAVAFVDPQTPQPELALDFLRFLTRNLVCQVIVLTEHAEALSQTQALLREVKARIVERLSGGEDTSRVPSDSFLVSVFSSFLMLLFIRQSAQAAPQPDSEPAPRRGQGRPSKNQSRNLSRNQSGNLSKSRSRTETPSQRGDQAEPEPLAELEELLDWALEHLLPPLTSGPSGVTSSPHKSLESGTRMSAPLLCVRLLQKLLGVCGTALLALELPGSAVEKLTLLCLRCLEQVGAGDGWELLEAVVECLLRLSELHFVTFCQAERAGTEMDTVVDWMQKIYTATATALQQPKIQHQQLLGSMQSAMAEMVAVVMQTHKLAPQTGVAPRLMDLTVAAMMEELDRASRRLDLERDLVTSDLQPLSGWLLSVVGRSTATRKLLMEAVSKSVSATEKLSLHCLHSCVHLTHCLLTGSMKGEPLAGCVAVLQEEFERRQREFSPSDQREDDDALEEEDFRPVLELISEKLKSCQTKLALS